ncbi:MAG: T9SS type A sorting domain-containing protein [Flavobacteriaceae bacterium]
MIRKLLGVFLMGCFFCWGQQQPASVASPTEEKFTFELSPNPLTQQPLKVVSNRKEIKYIRIYNALGHLVYQGKTTENQLFVDHLPKGIYILNLQQGPFSGSRRLIIP